MVAYGSGGSNTGNASNNSYSTQSISTDDYFSSASYISGIISASLKLFILTNVLASISFKNQSLKSTDVDIICNLLKTNSLPFLKILNLSHNPNAINSEQLSPLLSLLNLVRVKYKLLKWFVARTTNLQWMQQ